MTLGLLLAIFIASKRAEYRDLAKMSFIPGIFNINEPVIFGAPIVMNPILGIPFLVAPLITTTISYFATTTGIVPMMAARLGFAIPAPIAAWMSTNWSVAAGILVVVNFLITLAIYYPFFKVFEKQQLEREEGQATQE